jgi:hypothetical protein
MRKLGVCVVVALTTAVPSAAALAAPATRPGPASRIAAAAKEKLARPLRSVGNQLGLGSGHEGVPAGTSTPLQKALLAAEVSASALAVHSIGNLQHGWKFALAAGLGYVGYQLADFGGGDQHHSLDNYGDENTPFFGTQIRDFQSHHKFPAAAGQRTVPDLMAPLTVVGIPLMLAISKIPQDWWAVKAGLVGLAAGFVLNPIGHKYAHMKLERPQLRLKWEQLRDNFEYYAVMGLRLGGFFIDPRDHAVHHRQPHDENYAVMSGLTNRIADRSGYYRKKEKFLFKTFGLVPNTWKDPKRGREVMRASLGDDESTWPEIKAPE